MGNTFTLKSEEKTLEKHNERVDSLETIGKKARVYRSKMWGINERSVLSKIENFDVTQCFVHDPMHVRTDGIVTYECALMLHDFIFIKHYFTLEYLNKQIDCFSYSYLVKTN